MQLGIYSQEHISAPNSTIGRRKHLKLDAALLCDLGYEVASPPVPELTSLLLLLAMALVYTAAPS